MSIAVKKPTARLVYVVEEGRWWFKLWYGPRGDCKQAFRTLRDMMDFISSDDHKGLYPPR